MITNPRSLAFDEEGKRLVCEECTEWTAFEDLYVDENGQQWDVCKWCGSGESRPPRVVIGEETFPVLLQSLTSYLRSYLVMELGVSYAQASRYEVVLLPRVAEPVEIVPEISPEQRAETAKAIAEMFDVPLELLEFVDPRPWTWRGGFDYSGNRLPRQEHGPHHDSVYEMSEYLPRTFEQYTADVAAGWE